ncbi:MAG: sugar ABC transporter substrate-binding protein [Anaerolineae bacterium]|nr:sugar ABC transporter substrate-binding protein [Anaerolineae bacterium]
MLANKISRRGFVRLAGASMATAALAACATPTSQVVKETVVVEKVITATSAPAQKVTLRFTFWGSQLEKEAMLKACKDFEAENPNITMEASHIPDKYAEKLTAMLAANELPDIGYMVEDWTGEWGNEGRLLDLEPLIVMEGAAAERVSSAVFYGGGKIVGAGPELECSIMLYNKDIFDKAGMPYPPATADKSWTWSEFVEVARKLTLDANGKRPGESGFDSTKIEQFGFGPLPAIEVMLLSNDTGWFSPDGKECWLDKPATLEVYQSLADAINVHHVAPSPDQTSQLPVGTWQTLLSTGKVAMSPTGQWLLLDVAKANVNWGLMAYPKFKKPALTVFGMPVTIFASSKHPKEAWRFLSFLSNPEKVELYKNGLWMPVLKSYYTDPVKIDKWASGHPARPAEFKTAVLDYVLNYSKRGAWATLKNGPKVFAIINPEAEKVNLGNAKAADVLPTACPKIKPMLEGFWSRS